MKSRRRNRRRSEDTNISFLDVICCGFGAIVLLLVIVRPNQPLVLEESPIIQDGQVRALQERLFDIRGQVSYLETDLNAKQEQLGSDNRRVAILRSELDTLNSRLASVDHSDANASQAFDLKIAVQSLSREMKRLLSGRKRQNDNIGGIPVDSEYIIFIIDTSGSMFNMAWRRMVNEVSNTLKIYPKVKGIQVMNDQGQYMFPTYAGDWITDSAARRASIIKSLQNWNAFSNSSPVEGITAAIRRYYDKNKKISLYVMGDDYQGSSVRRVLNTVKNINAKSKSGDTLVRIHAVGFPVLFEANGDGVRPSAVRYAALMRALAEQNNGTFVGVNNVR